VISCHEMDNLSLYIHIPFCKHRCSYCDFNTYAGQESQIPAYVEALCREITVVAHASGARLPVHTIFFGGGTPSLLSPDQFDRILSTTAAVFDLQPNLEVTLEANPGTVSPHDLQSLRASGVNRISFGMQSADPGDLRLLDRQHQHGEVAQAVTWARAAGFDNLSLDLIYGLPQQTRSRWENTLGAALALHPDHLSLYALTIEPGTLLFRRSQQGLLAPLDDDMAAEMYELASDVLESHAYHQYEVSNWARCGEDGAVKACLHNLQYWRNRPYLGFGAGAHGFANGRRTANVNGIGAFVKRCMEGQAGLFPAGPAVQEVISIDPVTEMQETMMVGLRLIEEGVSPAAFSERFGNSLDQVFGKEINQLIVSGLLEGDDRIRLTKRARLLGNQVFRQFVG
jgi:oxygen-independent coproporphyrinogen III oxidase